MSTSTSVQTVIKIKGMFCRHCETTINTALMSLEGVSRVNASFEKEQAEIVYDPEIVSIDEIREKITEAGYEVKESGSFPKAAAILIILAALYIIARHTGLLKFFDIYPSIETAVSMGMLFGIGFLTSVHCIAMCGGINLTQSMVSSEKQGNLLRSNLLYNTGRIISYTLTGAICGGIGRTIGISGTLRGIIPIIAGVFMLIMALRMLGLFRFLRGIKLPDSFRFYKKLRLRFGGNKNSSSFIIGLMNGLMPCGPLQSMQLYALSTGSVFRGAASMFLFSLGTVPLMFGFGFFSGKLNMKYRKTMLTVSAVLVFLMGINMISNGLSLSGTAVPVPGQKTENISVVSDNIQKIQTEIDYGQYPAFTVQKGIPVEWEIFVPEGKLTGCNGEILVPAYGIDIKLNEGINTVRFTPEDEGIFPYSCWMGMIRSTITVTD